MGTCGKKTTIQFHLTEVLCNYTRNKSNTFRLNNKGFEGSLLNNAHKAMDGFQSFSNTIGHRSFNGLCLTSLLCKCYKWTLNNARNQTKIFRHNCTLTTPRSRSLLSPLTTNMFNKEVFTCNLYSTGLQFLKFDRPSINERELPTNASTTSAWRGGQREIRARETNNYKHVI